MRNCPAAIDIVSGDGRLSLERETVSSQSPRFDLLAIDAFSGDAIPVHLLTAECFEIYRDRVAPSGLLALHITNWHVDLEPVVEKLARQMGWSAVVVADGVSSSETGRLPSTWVLMSRSPQALAANPIATSSRPLRSRDDLPLWTDDQTDLIRVLR